jgi:hypothetical protein
VPRGTSPRSPAAPAMDVHEDSPLLARVVASGDVTGGWSVSGDVTGGRAASGGVPGGGAAMDSPLLARVVAELPENFRHKILPLLVGCMRLADIARVRHVIGCASTHATRVHSASNDVTGDFCHATLVATS